jgi:ABC-type nickel/cobalt efflux system permease component RcnA
MDNDYQQQLNNRAAKGAALRDFVMAFVVLAVGVIFLIYEKMGWRLFRSEPSVLDKVAGGLFIVYGIWRIYRGYKKISSHERS